MSEQTSETDGARRAREALEASGIEHRIARYGKAKSLAESAALRGIEPRDIVKSLVVRRGSGDYVFVLVPGDREISWPKLRAHLGVNRLSMPPADKALEATGYERGTITPFGSTTAWPVSSTRPRPVGRSRWAPASTVSGRRPPPMTSSEPWPRRSSTSPSRPSAWGVREWGWCHRGHPWPAAAEGSRSARTAG